jgi:hypothetical protein
LELQRKQNLKAWHFGQNQEGVQIGIVVISPSVTKLFKTLKVSVEDADFCFALARFGNPIPLL